MRVLCVIIARAGSKGLPDKNMADLCGRPMVSYTIEHAFLAERVERVVLSTDGDEIADVGKRYGVDVVARPAELASDTATIDSAVRHGVMVVEEEEGEAYDAVVILYGNVPLRPEGLIDRAIEKLEATGCDSVQSVAPVGKMHPYWMKRLGGEGGDVLEHYQENDVYRRQDLPKVYALDGGLIVVTRSSLFTVVEGRPHAFLGDDRRGVATKGGEVVDIDELKDLAVARAIMEFGDGGEEGDNEEGLVRIGGRGIGWRGDGVYVIAELGVNHDGSVERALEMVRSAKEACADAIKLQLFDAGKLLSVEAELAGYQKGVASDVYEMLDGLRLSVDEMMSVRRLAGELGLGFVVTPFSIEMVDDMRRLDVDAVKIASPDAVNFPLIEAMMGLGKPLLVSVGGCRGDEVAELDVMLGNHPSVIMQCVSSYPVRAGDANIGKMLLVGEGRGVYGYSDHTMNEYTGMMVVACGGDLIEKHLTYDSGAAGPDHAASFDPVRFMEYVRLIRMAEREIGDAGEERELLAVEKDVVMVSRQSVCAVRNLAGGDVIKREDVTVKRPGTGIPAKMLGDVVGKKMKRDVKADHLLRDGDVEM